MPKTLKSNNAGQSYGSYTILRKHTHGQVKQDMPFCHYTAGVYERAAMSVISQNSILMTTVKF